MTEYVPDRFGEPLGPEEAFWPGGDGELDPGPIAARLVDAEPLFEHLKQGEASLLFLMRGDERRKTGKMLLGSIALPAWKGELGAVATWMMVRLCDGLPDYVMILDAHFWAQASPMQREALVYHELCHTEQARTPDGELKFTADGLPVWGMRAHDLEEFNEVVARYGAWLPDVQAFISALRKGGAV